MKLGEGRSRRKVIVWIVALVLAVPSLWLIVGQVRGNLFPPPVPGKPVASAPSSPGVKPLPSPATFAPKPEAPTAGTVAPSLQAGTSVPVPIAGNLKELARLRAELEEARLQAAIAQEREKALSKTPAVPVTVAAPVAPVTVEPVRREVHQPGPVVESVQGADGRLTARVRLGSGKVVGVRPGDRLAGGIVETIGRDGVSVRQGRTLTMVGFE